MDDLHDFYETMDPEIMSGPTDTVHILVLCLAHTTHKHSDSCYIRVILTRFHCKKKMEGEHFREIGSRRNFFAALAVFAPLSAFDMNVAFLFIYF